VVRVAVRVRVRVPIKFTPELGAHLDVQQLGERLGRVRIGSGLGIGSGVGLGQG
jgi:hypothetical protein